MVEETFDNVLSLGPEAHVPQPRNPLRLFDPPPTKRAIGHCKDRVNERDTQEKDGIFVCVKFREREGLNRVRDDKNGVSRATHII